MILGIASLSIKKIPNKFSLMPRQLAIFLMFLTFCGLASGRIVRISPGTFKSVWSNVQPGDTVLFAPGVYRQSLLLARDRDWNLVRPTTFKPIAPNTVVIKGSDIVEDWRRLEISGGMYVRDWKFEPAQVFVDENPLIQLAGSIFDGYPTDPSSEYHKLHKENGGIWPGRIAYAPKLPMPLNSFYYDSITRELFIKILGSPQGKKIEVSTRQRLFYAEKVSGIILSGLIFEHANTSPTTRGAAVTIIGNDNIMQEITVQNVDLGGIQIVGNRNQLLDSAAKYNGQLGVTIRGKNNRIVNVESSYNNTRKFNKWWEAGGFKFVGNGGLQDSEIIGNRALHNQGDGIWFDWKNINNIISNNVSAYNNGFGIHYEASRTGIIQDNYVFGNSQRGIYLLDSAECLVTNNLVIGNGLEGIASIYTRRKDDDGSELGAGSNRIYSNLVGWNKGELIMPRGISPTGEADGNVYLTSNGTVQFSMGFPTVEFPSVYSLDRWKQISGLDKNSIALKLTLPTTIASSMQAKSIDIDWKALRSMIKDIVLSQGGKLLGIGFAGGSETIAGPRN